MTKVDYDYIYSLYDDDDGVILYDCLEHAHKAKSRLEEFVPIYGPFHHLRLEKPVITAAQHAVELLDRLFDKESELNPWQTAKEVRQVLQKALAEFVLKVEMLPESLEKGVEAEDTPHR